MDEKENKVENMQNSNSKKKKKGVKIAVIAIIIIVALIIAGLSVMLATGNDFETIIDNIEKTFDNKKDKKEDSKSDSEKNENSNTGNNTNNSDEPNGMASGNGGSIEISDFDSNFTKLNKTPNANKQFRLVYLTNGIKNITVGGASYVCNENDPHITGVNSDIVQKIENYIKDYYNTVWEDINSQTSDDYIKEILTGYNEYSLKNPDYKYDDIGFNQSCRDIFLSTKILTIKLELTGGLGGVSWNTTSGVSFDINHGNVINIKDIVTSKDEYISACKKYAMEQLKNDSRYAEVIETHKDDYESIIYEAIEKMGGYFVRDGIVCAEIPKYEIASGGAGEFKFIVPYAAIKDYINIEYLDDIDLTGNSYKEDTIRKEGYKFSTSQIEKMALDYYEAKTGYRPSRIHIEAREGKATIQLYDNMGDHNSTCDWYIVDLDTATGTDMMGNNIDLKTTPAREY